MGNIVKMFVKIVFAILVITISVNLFAENIEAPDDFPPDSFLTINDSGWNQQLSSSFFVAYVDAPLRNVFTDISKRTGLNIIFEGNAEISNVRFSYSWKSMTSKSLLWHICKKYNLSANWYYFPSEKSDNQIPNAILIKPK